MSLVLPSPGHQPTKPVGGSKHPVSQSVLGATVFCAWPTAFSERNAPHAPRRTTNKLLCLIESSSYSAPSLFAGLLQPMLAALYLQKRHSGANWLRNSVSGVIRTQ